MTTADTETKTALQELLDERQRYQGWLGALEQRRTATPAHVYERVQTDYTLRLERVMQRLRERAEQLSATIEGMQARLQTLRSREADRTDERNEHELRAAVGELTPDEWERRRGEADRELGALAQERSQIESELTELQRIVAMTREPEQQSAQAASQAGGAATAPEQREPEQQAPESARRESPPQQGGASTPERFAPATPAAAAAAAAARAAGAAGTRAPGAEEGAPSTAGEHPLAGRPGGESPSIDDFIAEWPLRQMGGEGTANGTTGDATAAGASGAPGTATWHPPASTSGAPTAPNEAHAHDIHAHDIHEHHVGEARRDMDKTLKCPECGAMNYATEWYCERCGGELASF